MLNEQRQLLRVAVAVHDILAHQVAEARRIHLPLDAWRRCESLALRLSKARQHGLLLAARRLEPQYLEATKALCQASADACRTVEQALQVHVCVSARDIYFDLLALRGEFDELDVDLRSHMVSVTTEPIVLEGVDLGRFEIQLDWTEIGSQQAADYRVIARDPNPASVDDSVTHPHVQDESLCEGEGRVAIRRSVEEGRLFDFFMIVTNLLRTYNPSSPYVSLSSWHGIECTDCGASVPEDEQWSCEQCRSTVCGGCTANCGGCDGVFCVGCLTACEGCDQRSCQDCLRRCTVCQARRCRDCLNQNDTCEDCHDETLDDATNGEDAEHEHDGSAAGAGAAIQPNGLGEAPVPA